LADAGWKDNDGDGIMDKDGQPFVFEIITNQGNEIRAKCAEIIQRRLGEIGIKVKIRILEWAAFVNDFINKRRFDATILGWTVPLDPDIYDVWHSSKMGPQELNFISYKNEEVDTLIERGRSTFNQKERKKYYDRIQEILAEEQPYLFLLRSRCLAYNPCTVSWCRTGAPRDWTQFYQVVRSQGGTETGYGEVGYTISYGCCSFFIVFYEYFLVFPSWFFHIAFFHIHILYNPHIINCT